MEDRFSKAFARGIANPLHQAAPVVSSLFPSIQPRLLGVDEQDATLRTQAEHFGKLGLGKIAMRIVEAIPSDQTALLPLDPATMEGLMRPLTQQTCLQIGMNKSFGNTWGERFNIVKAYLVLAQSESNFDPHPKSTHYGQLQFDKATAANAFSIGTKLFAGSKVFGFTQAYMQRLAGSKADNDQVLMNVGQLWYLTAAIIRQWDWTDKGWTPKPEVANNTITKQLLKMFPAILHSHDLGEMALLTFYHTNGVNGLAATRTTIAYPARISKDVLAFYRLGRTPGLDKYVNSSLPPQMLSKLIEGGDIEEDEDPGLVAISLNEWWKIIIPLAFSVKAAGTGMLKSDYGHRKEMTDADTGKIIAAHTHKGQDYRANVGQPIFALFTGHVTVARDNGNKGYGKEMVITNRVGGFTQKVGHLSLMLYNVTNPPTLVKKGDIIGLAGSSGNSTGPHLHIEVAKWPSTGAGPLKPEKWPASGKYAVNAKGV